MVKWIAPSGGGYQAKEGSKPKGAPPKNPASSSRVVQPAGTEGSPPLRVAKVTSKAKIMLEILEVLKEIRDELKKPKEPAIVGKRALEIHSVNTTIAGFLLVDDNILTDDGEVVRVLEIAPSEDNYPKTILAIKLGYPDGAIRTVPFAYRKTVKVVTK